MDRLSTYHRVLNGANFLDSVARKTPDIIPTNWREQIQMPFDISSDICCVIGQLNGEFWGAVGALGIDDEDVLREHGFLTYEYEDPDDLTREWANLLYLDLEWGN